MHLKSVVLPLSLFLFIVFTNSCSKEEKAKNSKNNRLEFIKKTEKRNSNLLNKNLDLSLLLDEDTIFSKQSSKRVIVVSMLSDCSGCRKTAYNVASRLQKSHTTPLSLVLGTDIKVSHERLNNGLLELPYVEDMNLKIKSQLNLFHTPTILFITDGKIKKTLSLYPYDEVSGYDEEKQITEFISSVIFD